MSETPKPWVKPWGVTDEERFQREMRAAPTPEAAPSEGSALEIAGKALSDHCGHYHPPAILQAYGDARARSARLEERQRCAKLVCSACRQSFKIEPELRPKDLAVDVVLRNMHINPAGQVWGVCEAVRLGILESSE